MHAVLPKISMIRQSSNKIAITNSLFHVNLLVPLFVILIQLPVLYHFFDHVYLSICMLQGSIKEAKTFLKMQIVKTTLQLFCSKLSMTTHQIRGDMDNVGMMLISRKKQNLVVDLSIFVS